MARPVADHELMTDALAALPTEAQRAFFRLLLDAIIARAHLRGVEGFAAGWPSFVAVGPTKTGKSLLVLGAIKVLGIREPVVRSAPAETERSLWGRRYQTPKGWGFQPGRLLSYPLVVLEELDKAPRPLQRSCLKLLQGEVSVPAEDDVPVGIAPTVVALANADVSFLPDEYRRRSVVLDTGPLVPDLGQLHSDASQFMSALPAAAFELDDLSVIGALPLQVKERMLRLLEDGLNERGWRMVDERAIGYMVLGRYALMGGSIFARADEVVADYLSVAATVYETADSPSHEVELLPSHAERAEAIEAGESRARAQRAKERQDAITLGALKRKHLSTIESLLELIRDWPIDPPDILANIEGAWIAVADQLEAASSVDELREILEDASEKLETITLEVVRERSALVTSLNLPEHGTRDRMLSGCLCDKCERLRVAAPEPVDLTAYLHGSVERFFTGCGCRKCLDAAIAAGGESAVIQGIRAGRQARRSRSMWAI